MGADTSQSFWLKFSGLEIIFSWSKEILRGVLVCGCGQKEAHITAILSFICLTSQFETEKKFCDMAKNSLRANSILGGLIVRSQAERDGAQWVM